jgi:hypothetical protein
MQLGLKEQRHVMKERYVKADTLCRGARSIAPGDHVSRIEILHRKVKRIKLHETPIASSEITNG